MLRHEASQPQNVSGDPSYLKITLLDLNLGLALLTSNICHLTSNMQLAIMQPYLFPYLGYFQLMHRADRFVFIA